LVVEESSQSIGRAGLREVEVVADLEVVDGGLRQRAIDSL
jgi:hypothetical protein